jgi:hypothetical protein
MQAEAVIGPDEHLFKVEFVSLIAPHELPKLTI